MNGYSIPTKKADLSLGPPLPTTPPDVASEVPPAALPADGTVLQEPPQPTASVGTHPLAVSPEEGLFAVPQEQMLKLLQKALKLKYTAVLMYINYGDRVRSHFRDAVYDHWQEHMGEERTACYDLAMKITALGGEPDVQVSKVPATGALSEMFMHIMQMEKQLIQGQRDILAVCGENEGLRILIENSLLADQRHLDDARRMMVPLL